MAGKDPRQEFKTSRIPGSRFFDVDRVSDPNTDLPHMLPSAGAFAAAADALGISADEHVTPFTAIERGTAHPVPQLQGFIMLFAPLQEYGRLHRCLLKRFSVLSSTCTPSAAYLDARVQTVALCAGCSV